MQHKHNKMVIMIGKRPLTPIASAGRETFAVDKCVSAAGTNVPPLIVVRRRRRGVGGYGWSSGGLNL